MVIIAIQETKQGFTLYAADTYIGASTQFSGATIDEVMLRFHPLLRNWVETCRPRPKEEIERAFPADTP